MKKNKHLTAICILSLLSITSLLFPQGEVEGTMKLWYPVTITFDGPQADESSATFRDYRLDVTFTKDSRNIKAAGFFAADGNAAETSAGNGNKWRVRFTPDEAGDWSYLVSFRTGQDVAASMDPNAGSPGSIDGQSGSFTMGPADPGAPGFYSKGLLQYVGEHYLQFKGSKEWFVKGGPGSPENIMAYFEFDGTVDKGGDSPATGSKLHEWPKYLQDWQDGDPTWKNGKGKAMIGLMNYIAGTGCNTVYMIPMNVNGDGRDCWPWTSYEARDIYDVSKLAQWDIVLRHMDKLGLNKDYYLAESENTTLLNGGDLGTERRIYHRELVARFGYLLGIRFNFSEEPTSSNAQVAESLEHLDALEAHGHPVGTHTKYKDATRDPLLNYLLGKSYVKGAWAQIHTNHYEEVKEWVTKSRDAGFKWTVSVDESSGTSPSHAGKARDEFWSAVMAGGEGLDVYFNKGDNSNEDWRPWEPVWKVVASGVRFFQFPEVNPHLGRNGGVVIADDLGSGHILANESIPEQAFYIIKNNGGNLNMAKAKGEYEVWWYEIDKGGSLQRGSVQKVTGGGTVSLGEAPSGGNWVIVVTKPVDSSPTMEQTQRDNIGDIPFRALQLAHGRIQVNFHLPEAAEVTLELFSNSGARLAVLADGRRMDAGSHTLTWKNGIIPRGPYIIRMGVGKDGVEQSRFIHMR